MSTPYKQPDGTYLIPWADLRAAGAWDRLCGSATTSPTVEAAMCRIEGNARKAREWLLGETDPGRAALEQGS